MILLTEEWAWLRTTPSRPWHRESFVDCLELSLAWAVLESHEDVVEKPLNVVEKPLDVVEKPLDKLKD